MNLKKDRTVKIGATSKVQVKYVKPQFRTDAMLESYGEYCHKNETITIQDDLTPEQSGATLLHESLHKIYRDACLTAEGNVLAEDKDEERVVFQTEVGIYSFFLDNPHELAIVFYQIFKDNPKLRKLIASIK
tara:strand:- start:1516 stop:1911 length:396 start_codon:yes stop_codon:yes gene_type:complete